MQQYSVVKVLAVRASAFVRVCFSLCPYYMRLNKYSNEIRYYSKPPLLG